MTTEPPDFATLAQLEDAALAAKLDAVRAALKHGGEKGRALEQAVTLLLRDLLPAEYGGDGSLAVELSVRSGKEILTCSVV